jgi:ApaG protein
MPDAVTQGVRISVAHHFQGPISAPLQGEFVFAYRIRIENLSGQDLRLVSRHWTVMESTGRTQAINGEGVRGIQPRIPAGDTHEYASWCRVRTELGKMGGYYLMERTSDGEQFRVRIPDFQLVAPMVLN